MTGLSALLRKELKEQLRTYRLLIVGGIFLFFGISTPLMLKYLPEIMEFAGEEIMVTFPPPSAAQALNEYIGTIGQLGVLVTVLVAMGCIAGEMRNGTVLMTLSKPVSRTAFVTAKLIAVSLTFLVSMIVASIFCFVYTTLLIESSDVLSFIYVNLLLGLFLVFCLAVTLFFSSIFKSSLAAGGVSIAVIIAQAGLSGLPRFGDYMPGKLLGWGNDILSAGGDSYWWAVGVSVAVIFLCVYLAQWRLKNKDL